MTHPVPSLPPDQRDRLWQHVLHEENVFYNRLNFFLVFHSVLLGVVGVLLSTDQPNHFILKVIILTGFIMAFIWLYGQAKQKLIIDILTLQVRQELPEFRAYQDQIRAAKWFGFPLVGRLQAYLIPSLVAFLWGLLFFY